jgi:Carboxypeptidase regulatory-like domain
MRTLIGIALTILLFLGPCFAQVSSPALGSIRGDVFTKGTNGEPAVLPGARIVLRGPITKETESDAQGAFAIDGLPPGTYQIEANAPGLSGGLAVEVTAGTSSTVPLEMNVTTVSNSVNVTASAEPADTKEPSGTSTVGESAVRNMPNIDEHFQSLLPLIPGVVRGPNGLINMKGARASQNGSLVNSADVTDPATGTAAINIPIDVVSSIHILSTPYDPEYGKFTGAVSNVEARSGDFDKFRVSGQNFLPRFRRIDGSIMGIAAFTPRITFSGPIVKDRVAFTQSVEYRYERDPADSLPPLQSYNRSENFNSYTQLDVNISPKQTATASFAIFPQRLDYYGLNTFTPQASTPDLNERG